MNYIKSCEFNIDTACVEVKLTDGSMVSIVSMIRRGSVIIPFLYGVMILREKNVKSKIFDLVLLMISLALLVIGSGL